MFRNCVHTDGVSGKVKADLKEKKIDGEQVAVVLVVAVSCCVQCSLFNQPEPRFSLLLI